MTRTSEAGNEDTVKAMLRKFNDKINTDLQTNVIAPMTGVVKKVRDLERRVNDITDNSKDVVAPTHTDEILTADLLSSVSENVVPTHLEETVRFVLTMVQLADKKDVKPAEIVDKIREDYGKVCGKSLSIAMGIALKDSKKKKIKDVWDEVERLL